MTLAIPTPTTPRLAPRSPVLQLTDLEFAYPGQAPVLNGLNLTIHPGERIGLVGPNGAGKTTLFLSICGVLTPAQGQIQLFEQPVRSQVFRPELGFVFQNAADQLFSLSVREDVAFGPINMGLSEAEVELRVQEALALTGTSHLADRIPHHLSGGERRMVAIATILSMRPQFVIYDEPSANLDLRARRRLIRFLQHCPPNLSPSLARTLPPTMMVASHDLELILEVCDRLLLLDGGQILADGPPRQIMANGELMEAHGLEVPGSLAYRPLAYRESSNG